jgi:phospholipid-binding lipoprotein MlaA
MSATLTTRYRPLLLVCLAFLLCLSAACSTKTAQAPQPLTGSDGEPILLAQAGTTASDADPFGEIEEDYAEDDFADVQVDDPIEGFNRAMFWVNDKLWFYVLKPVGLTWSAFPQDWRNGIDNAFYNVRMPGRVINNVFQGKFKRAGKEVVSFAFNSVFGIGGLARPSETVSWLKEVPEEDTGQTFGHWGVGHGAYLVLPVFGPSSLRDGVGLGVDQVLDPISWLEPGKVRYPLSAGEAMNEASMRVRYVKQPDGTYKLVDDYANLKESFIDPYVGIRNAYIQNRNAKVEE